MKSAWRIAGGTDEDREDEGTETALTTTKTFKGKCNKCKKKGHKANKCPEKGSSSGETAGAATMNDKTDVCSHCKKTGHKAESCWKKFPEKVPEWAKELRTTKKPASTGEAAGATEVLVCSINIGCDHLDGVPENYGGTDGDLLINLCDLEMGEVGRQARVSDQDLPKYFTP